MDVTLARAVNDLSALQRSLPSQVDTLNGLLATVSARLLGLQGALRQYQGAVDEVGQQVQRPLPSASNRVEEGIRVLERVVSELPAGTDLALGGFKASLAKFVALEDRHTAASKAIDSLLQSATADVEARSLQVVAGSMEHGRALSRNAEALQAATERAVRALRSLTGSTPALEKGQREIDSFTAAVAAMPPAAEKSLAQFRQDLTEDVRRFNEHLNGLLNDNLLTPLTKLTTTAAAKVASDVADAIDSVATRLISEGIGALVAAIDVESGNAKERVERLLQFPVKVNHARETIGDFADRLLELLRSLGRTLVKKLEQQVDEFAKKIKEKFSVDLPDVVPSEVEDGINSFFTKMVDKVSTFLKSQLDVMMESVDVLIDFMKFQVDSTLFRVKEAGQDLLRLGDDLWKFAKTWAQSQIDDLSWGPFSAGDYIKL